MPKKVTSSRSSAEKGDLNALTGPLWKPRVIAAFRHMTSGFRAGEVVDKIRAEFEISEQQAYVAIAGARKLFVERAKFDLQEEVGKGIQRLETIHNLAMNPPPNVELRIVKEHSKSGKIVGEKLVTKEVPANPDFYNASNAESTRLKLIGAFAPEKSELSITNVETLTPQERKTRIEKLEKERERERNKQSGTGMVRESGSEGVPRAFRTRRKKK